MERQIKEILAQRVKHDVMCNAGSKGNKPIPSTSGMQETELPSDVAAVGRTSVQSSLSHGIENTSPTKRGQRAASETKQANSAEFSAGGGEASEGVEVGSQRGPRRFRSFRGGEALPYRVGSAAGSSASSQVREGFHRGSAKALHLAGSELAIAVGLLVERQIRTNNTFQVENNRKVVRVLSSLPNRIQSLESRNFIRMSRFAQRVHILRPTAGEKGNLRRLLCL
jgi:hypothetical protein